MRVWYVYLIAAWSVFSGIVDGSRTFDAFIDSGAPWRVRYDQRYENLLGAVFSAILFGACVAYEIRRRGESRSGNAAAGRRRWRDKREVRAVLYCFAGLQIIAVPLCFYKAFQAAHTPSPWGPTTLWDQLDLGGVIMSPLVACAVIAFDRYRLYRDQRDNPGCCARCGYDLRATPARCPECGAIPAMLPIAEVGPTSRQSGPRPNVSS